ncbi:MAG: adenylate/guanylate cyclase domain-containing protein [Pirellulaceae bacterium]
MIAITIEGPNQKEKLAAINMPCGFGRQADASNPELSVADPFVSRRHVELETTGHPEELLVRCVGSSPITLASGELIQPSQEKCIALPLQIRIGRTDIVVEQLEIGFRFLKPPATQVIDGRTRAGFDALSLRNQNEVSPEQLIQWFEGLIALQDSASGATRVFEQAAKAVVEMVGLDRCVVIRCEGEWKVDVEYGNPSPDGMVYSHSVVGHALAYRQTVFAETSSRDPSETTAAFVAAPIFDGTGAVAACLFAARDQGGDSQPAGIRPLEAQLVQVTAGVVGNRLARLTAEAEQTRTQVQLEQFASPQLVQEMQNNPQWLEAQERELSLLFGDIRGFSKLGEHLDANEIYTFVREVMDCMTQVIHDHGGFVFNFAGDGIAAMWNAPGRTVAHAKQACQAAIEIQRSLRKIDVRWAKRVGREVKVGLGINSGSALVGNSGSKARLKYSPLGHAVNLASRVEGATKQFDVPILITDTTKQHIGDEFSSRDLGEVIVVGIDHPTRVYQLAGNDDPSIGTWWPKYDEALKRFERGENTAAKAIVDGLLEQFPDDRSLLILLDRLNQSDGPAQPWVLSGK